LNCDSFCFYEFPCYKIHPATEITACDSIVFQEYLFEISVARAYIYSAEGTENMVDTYCNNLNVVYSLRSAFLTVLIYYDIVHLTPGILSAYIIALALFLLYCVSIK